MTRSRATFLAGVGGHAGSGATRDGGGAGTLAEAEGRAGLAFLALDSSLIYALCAAEKEAVLQQEPASWLPGPSSRVQAIHRRAGTAERLKA